MIAEQHEVGKTPLIDQNTQDLTYSKEREQEPPLLALIILNIHYPVREEGLVKEAFP